MNPGEKWITSKNLEPVEACWRMQSFNVFMFNIDFNLPDMPQIIQRSCGIWFARCLSFQGADRWLIRRHIRASWEKPAHSCLSAFRIPYLRVQAAAGWCQSSAMGFVTKTIVGLQETGKESLPLLKSKESCNCSAKCIEQRTEEGCRLRCSYWTFSSVAWPFQCGDSPPQIFYCPIKSAAFDTGWVTWTQLRTSLETVLQLASWWLCPIRPCHFWRQGQSQC